MKRGVLYIAFGSSYIEEVLRSARSVKKHNPDMHITAFFDREVESDFVDEVKMIKVSHIRAKVDYVHTSPYEQTIFLDSDTIINRNITDMFDVLSKYDLAICHDLARKRANVSKIIPEYKKIPYSFSEVNPGVIVFKKCKSVQGFFKLWRKLFYKYISVWPYEQPTFRVALWESDINFYILPVEYNIRSKMNREKQRRFHHEFGDEHLAPRIYHMHTNEFRKEDFMGY